MSKTIHKDNPPDETPEGLRRQLAKVVIHKCGEGAVGKAGPDDYKDVLECFDRMRDVRDLRRGVYEFDFHQGPEEVGWMNQLTYGLATSCGKPLGGKLRIRELKNEDPPEEPDSVESLKNKIDIALDLKWGITTIV